MRLKQYLKCAHCWRTLAWKWPWQSKSVWYHEDHRYVMGACPCESRSLESISDFVNRPRTQLEALMDIRMLANQSGLRNFSPYIDITLAQISQIAQSAILNPKEE